MRSLLPVFLLFAILTACSNKEENTEQPVTTTTEFPYKLASIPDDWTPFENKWFYFYLPPGWRQSSGWTFDSDVGFIVAPDSTLVLYFDDHGFGTNIFNESKNQGTWSTYKKADSSQHIIYYDLAQRKAKVFAYESYWMSTREEDTLSTFQFAMACRILQTIELKVRSFNDEWYFKKYDSGKYHTNNPDNFKQLVKLRSRELRMMGFAYDGETLLTSQTSFDNHWWIKTLRHPNIQGQPFTPNQTDWDSIDSIRQFTFQKNWKFIIEEWDFSDEKSADRWLTIANNSRYLRDQKPPHVYWKTGDKIYFIVATAAKDWFEHGDSVVKLFTGKNEQLLSLFNNPLNVKKYKSNSGANSSPKTAKDYHYSPDTIGTHYQYFWFHHLRPTFRNRAFNGLYLHTYIYGDEIGTYTDVEEELIAVKSRLPDKKLGHLDFVGKTRKEINNMLGDGKVQSETIFWDALDDAYLIIHFENDTADWFNYTKTNRDVSYHSFPPIHLLYFEESFPDEEQ